ncbi:hypothetical protein PUN28_000996 [Cardiocondyla obscurior]|uniref:DM10 domain-containing protein n=1 Tax=Cardiocondyla obscurior TaxID=286306 RepID=A0AAW2H2X9_9HYME
MSTDCSNRYAFEAEWYDKIACMLKKFYVYYYPFDNTVNWYFDLKTKKTFLRRTTCEGIMAKDFYVGGVITIFSRCIKITEFLLLKPGVDYMGEILKDITNYDLYKYKMTMLTVNNIEVWFAKDVIDKEFVINYLISGPVVALELLGGNGIVRWQELAGSEDIKKACLTTASSLRTLYEKDEIHAVYGSKDLKHKNLRNTATLQNCTCCIVKPHAVQEKLVGAIINDIQKAGFAITAVQQFYINPINCEEFLEIYKGNYNLAHALLWVTHKDENLNIVANFRDLCGPMDPEIARQVRPNTLRAKYGKTKVQNAVHCSDLTEDGILEVEYFFKILDGR